jgi:hypothetical protein
MKDINLVNKKTNDKLLFDSFKLGNETDKQHINNL